MTSIRTGTRMVVLSELGKSWGHLSAADIVERTNADETAVQSVLDALTQEERVVRRQQKDGRVLYYLPF